VGKCGLDSSGLGQEPMVGCRGHRSEPLGSINGGEFLDQMREYYLLKKDSAPRRTSVVIIIIIIIVIISAFAGF
jgi:hypothetical protein